MCTILTFGAPAGTSPALLRERFGGGVHPIEHPRAAKWFGEGALYFYWSICNCGTQVGGEGRRSIDRERWEAALERDLARHREAGWSATKIERWLADKRKARTRREHDRDAGNPEPTAAEWAERWWR